MLKIRRGILILFFLGIIVVFGCCFVSASAYIEKVELNREPAISSTNSLRYASYDYSFFLHTQGTYARIKVNWSSDERFLAAHIEKISPSGKRYKEDYPEGVINAREYLIFPANYGYILYSPYAYNSSLTSNIEELNEPGEWTYNITLCRQDFFSPIYCTENIQNKIFKINISDSEIIGEKKLGKVIFSNSGSTNSETKNIEEVTTLLTNLCTLTGTDCEVIPSINYLSFLLNVLQSYQSFCVKSNPDIYLNKSFVSLGVADVDVFWRNFNSLLCSPMHYDRAVITLVLPSDIGVISSNADINRTDSLSQKKMLIWIVNGADKLIEPMNNFEKMDLRISEPKEQNTPYNIIAKLDLQFGPFGSKDYLPTDLGFFSVVLNRHNFPVYNYTKWKVDPDNSVWFTVTQKTYENTLFSGYESECREIFQSYPVALLNQDIASTTIDIRDYFKSKYESCKILKIMASGMSNVNVTVRNFTINIATKSGWIGEEKINLTLVGENGSLDSGMLSVISIRSSNLSNTQLTPTSGDVNNVFTYSIIFKDATGRSPGEYKVFIDGVPHSMIPGSGKIPTGKTYTYSTKLPNGNHNYYFEFRTVDGVLRYPYSGVINGPSITVPPTLLGNGNVNPTSGITTTVYNYYVTYKNPSGQAPRYMQVVIDNGHQYCDMYPVSSDFVNGAVYKCSTATLSLGQHNYYFTAHLKDDSIVRYPLNTALIGPSVADSGNLQVSIVPRENYHVGDNAWFDITIKDPNGNYVDPDGTYPIQVCQVPPFNENVCYLVQRSDVGRYYAKQWPSSLTEGYTTITATVDKKEYKPVSVSIQYFFGNISALSPVRVDDIKINPLSINPGITKVNVSYNISKNSLVSINIIDSNNNTIRNLINHASRDSGVNVEEWDGKDKNGNYVPDDSYLIKIEAVNVQAMQNIAPFGVSGRGYGQLQKPRGIWAQGDKIYVVGYDPQYTDTYKGSIFKKDTSIVKEFGNSNIFAPMSIALDSNGNIYTISTKTYSPIVKVFDSSGNYAREFGGGIINQDWHDSKPPCITIDNEDYIYAGSGQSVYKFSSSGNLVSSFPVPGMVSPDAITGISVDEGKSIWVSSYHSVVKKLSQDGNKLLTFEGAPYSGVGISVRRDGIVFTKGRDEIYVQDEDGAFLYSQNCPSYSGQNGIYADSDGYVYATCSTDGNKKLNKFKDTSTKDSKTARISADRNPPQGSMSEPLEGDAVDGHYLNELEIRGNADDSEFDYYLLEWSNLMRPGAWHLISRGDVSVENGLLGKWSFENLNSGNYTLRLSVYDRSGTVSQASVSVSYSDDVAPLAQLRNTGNVTVNNMIIVEAVSSDEDTNFVDFEYKEEGGEWKSAGRDYTNDYFVNLDTRGLEGGKIELRAVATDTANNTDNSPSSVFLEVDNAAPSIAITNPVNNSEIEDSTNISAFALNESVSSVVFQYRMRGDLLWVNIGSVDTEEPWSREWNTQYLYSGKYELRALAIDELGNIDKEAKIIEVNVIPPQCTSGACCDISTGTFKAQGSQPTGYVDDTTGLCSGSSTSETTCTNSPTGICYILTKDYYCNGNSSDAGVSYSLQNTCGTCKYCSDNKLTCDNYNPLTICSSLFDCSYLSYYYIEGNQSPTETSYCKHRDYGDNYRYCDGFGSCSLLSCAAYSNLVQAIAGICQYLEGCSGGVAGTVKNYDAGTSCGTGKQCDGYGSCAILPECNKADFNNDGIVDASDYITLKRNIGRAGSKSQGDANGNGVVDYSDLSILNANMGVSTGQCVESLGTSSAGAGETIAINSTLNLTNTANTTEITNLTNTNNTTGTANLTNRTSSADIINSTASVNLTNATSINETAKIPETGISQENNKTFEQENKDTDSDSVNDKNDSCPNTGKGKKVDKNGCSAEQFCELIKINSKADVKKCESADWKANEARKKNPQDCSVETVKKTKQKYCTSKKNAN